MDSKLPDTAKLAARQKRRQKWARRGVAAALAVSAATVFAFYWLGRKHAAPPAAPPPHPVPRGVRQQLTGFTMTRSERNRQIFRIQAARTLDLKQGGTVILQDVLVKFYGEPGGQSDLLRTEQAEYNALSGDLFTSRNVELELNVPPSASFAPAAKPAKTTRASSSTPLLVKTSRVSYRRQDSLIRTDAPVKFQVGAIIGTAQGLTFDTRNGELDLMKDIAAKFASPTGKLSAFPVHLTAAHLHYSKEERTALLTGPVTITEGSWKVTAGDAVIGLNAQNQVTAVSLSEGITGNEHGPSGVASFNARGANLHFLPGGGLRSLLAEGKVSGRNQQEGNLSFLQADRVEIEFSGPQAKPAAANLQGNVVLTFLPASSRNASAAVPNQFSADAAGQEKLVCQNLTLLFRSGGRSLRRAATSGPGTVTIYPRGAETGGRVIDAGRFAMDFDHQSRIRTLIGSEGTKVTLLPTPARGAKSSPVITTAQDLTAEFNPQTQVLTSMTQQGNFRFQQSEWRGFASSATYSSSGQSVTLTGEPRIKNAGTWAQARHVRMDLQQDRAVAWGRVQVSESQTGGSAADEQASTLPASVLADRAVFNWKDNVADYEGHVRAWRDDDVLEAPSLEVDRLNRQLIAGSGVVSSFLEPAASMAGRPAPTGRDSRLPVTVRARHLTYSDRTGTAVYQGDVRLATEGATLRSDRMEVHVARGQGGNGVALERAVATGHVRVTEPGRRATGDRAVYTAQDGKIVLTGGPPRLTDASKGLVTGRRLTFFIRGDRLLVDGGNGSPAVTTHRVAQ